MQANTTKAPAAIRVDLAAIFVSLELSRSKWLVTSLSPGGGERMSRHLVSGGDIPGLLDHFAELQRKAEVRTGQSFRVISIQEAGLDGFWIHRVLEREGIESYVVDPASIATSRRRRRAKTDRIDGEALVRALLAYNRGEPRVCAVLRVPTPEEEDRRRLVRERKALTNERIRHVNRIKGLLFSQGVSGYEPLKGDRRKCLDALITGDGRPLPPALMAQISREPDRIELLMVGVGITLIYRYGPSRERAKWKWASWGAFLAAVVWIAVSIGFSYYLENFANYNATYGALGAVIGLMMWTWISVVILVVGAELNSEMEHQTAMDTTTGAQQPMGARGATVADILGGSADAADQQSRLDERNA
ncbi:YihY/virulence factor BrkB family protein [Mesorhizobium sp. M0991]|uniref:YhjD/YihY/BrkB family envelope integrity protein n=1 Tax=Mesorhizobium sp. M0991 TaxID=2957043 RepID=UPI00333A1330